MLFNVLERPSSSELERAFSKFSSLDIKALVAFVPLFTALVYLAGRWKFEAWLWDYGLHPSMFPQTTADILFTASWDILWLAFTTTMGIVLMCVVMLNLIALVALALTVGRIAVWRANRKPLANGANPHHQGPKTRPTWAAGLRHLLTVIFPIVMLTLIFSAVLFHFMNERGAEVTQTSKLLWKQGKLPSTMISLVDGTQIKGYQIICGPSTCAFWTDAQTLVLRHDQYKRLVVTLPTEAR